MTNIPRPEHPQPQFERKNWRNLNGIWEFDYDFGVSAIEKELHKNDEKLPLEILVPFCPESKLSGIEHKDFMNAVCYRKKINISEQELEGKLFIHFGAVDYKSTLYINGEKVGTHLGGYSSFKYDISKYAHVGENIIFLHVEDDVRSRKQPRGKQASKLYSSGCDYTRTTGIWQTVWLETVPEKYIKGVKYYPDIEDGTLMIIGETSGKGSLEIKTSFNGTDTGSKVVNCHGGVFKAIINLTEKHLWDVGKGNLYDITFKFEEDEVRSYFGLRQVRMDGMKFMLNNKSVFQRLVLDQGFYPDGIYTAPDEKDLIKDIELSLAAGFNGARLHEKVFEARFLYHCDRLGYIVWGEHANWGMDDNDFLALDTFLNEWYEIVERDFNHPSIIGWCPFNETWDYVEKDSKTRLLSTVYKFTKMYDVTRPVIDTSGGHHCHLTDIYDTHDYDQNVETFKAHYDEFAAGGELFDYLGQEHKDTQHYDGVAPVFISEYGGIQWNTNGNDGWGYGTAPKTVEEFVERFKGLANVLLDNPKIMGMCYTQLYDIEQEINGLYTYDRTPKFDMNIFKKILLRKAVIED